MVQIDYWIDLSTTALTNEHVEMWKWKATRRSFGVPVHGSNKRVEGMCSGVDEHDTLHSTQMALYLHL